MTYKWRHVSSLPIIAYMLILLGYGLIRYPDGPLHPCQTAGYCGKRGQPHTELEYRQFMTWQSMLLWTWAPCMLVVYLLQRDRIHRR